MKFKNKRTRLTILLKRKKVNAQRKQVKELIEADTTLNAIQIRMNTKVLVKRCIRTSDSKNISNGHYFCIFFSF